MGLMDPRYLYATKKEKEIIVYSVYPSTRTPDLNLVLTEMDSPLVNKLMDCAKAVADGDLKLADFLFEEMEVLTAEETSEVTKKVVSCFSEALARRVHRVYTRNPVPLLSSFVKCKGDSFWIFISFSTFNALVNAFRGACISGNKAVHFIDFSSMPNLWQGEWFLRASAPLPVFRLTNIGPNLCKNNYHLQEMQRKLAEMARKLNISFQHKQFEANFPADIEECVLRLERTSEDEIVIVRWECELHKMLAVDGAIERVLSKLRELKPNFMWIIEQEANHNISDFFERFALSFQYYSVVFHYVNYLLCDGDGKKVLEKHWRRQISNIVACEGIDRIERHQTFAQWKERLHGAGFHPVQVSLIPQPFEINPGSPVVYPTQCPLFSVSLWKPIDPAQFSSVAQGVDINCPITIQDESGSSVTEPEEVCSSESDDDNTFDSDQLGILRIEKKWSAEEVREYLVSSLSERESKRINRWMSRQLTGNFAGRDRKLNVPDASLASLLRIPPPKIPFGKDNEYYVDDSVINAFFELLKKRWEKFPNLYMKNYSLPTWIMSLLLGKRTETEVLSYLNIEEITGTSKLLVPVCLENHWILVCVHIERRALMWLDSLHLPSEFHRTEKSVISKWIIEHLMPKLGYDNAQEWRVFEPVDIPYQTNLVDCGIFVMKFADCLAHGDHFPFTQENMPHFRHRVFLDIYHGRLPIAVSNSLSSHHQLQSISSPRYQAQRPQTQAPALFQSQADTKKDYWQYSQLLQSSGDFHRQQQEQQQQPSSLLQQMFYNPQMPSLQPSALSSFSSSTSGSSLAALSPGSVPSTLSPSASSFPLLFAGQQLGYFRPPQNQNPATGSVFPVPPWTDFSHNPSSTG